MALSFYNEAKTLKNLFEAWRHVRARAYASREPKIRDDARNFENESHYQLKRIQGRLGHGTYVFPPVKGILKDKKVRELANKRPRPIVLAPIEARVVQRAILQVLQPNVAHQLYGRLGRLREVNESRFALGGIPGGGVSKSISAVMSSLQDKYEFVFKSDIAAFFTRIHHEPVVTFIREQTGDEKIAKLFELGLLVELENAAEMRDYIDLFPQGGVGVPQGSALSALAGNILLFDFDIALNDIPDVRAFRYIDDLLILGRTHESVMAGYSLSCKLLKPFQMKLYDPAKSPDKAERGHARSGFTYLGCYIQKNHIAPSAEACRKLLHQIGQRISSAKKLIASYASEPEKRRKIDGVFVQSLRDIDLIIYGWGQSFRFASNRLASIQNDKAIDRLLAEYRNWFEKLLKTKRPTQQRRMLGVSLLGDLEHRPLEG